MDWSKAAQFGEKFEAMRLGECCAHPLFCISLHWLRSCCCSLWFGFLEQAKKHTCVLYCQCRPHCQADTYTTCDCSAMCAPCVHAETPAQHMQKCVAMCLAGDLPDVASLLAVRDALYRSADVYKPTADTMQQQMQNVDVSAHELSTNCMHAAGSA